MRLAVVAFVFLAFAASLPTRVEAAKAADHKAGEGKAEDKVDPFKGEIQLTGFSIVVFLVLFFLLGKFAWPQIRDGLDRREKAIARDRHEADLARKEAGELREKLQAEMARANEQIREMMDKARKDAQQTAADELARGKAELQAERERLQRELRITADDALARMLEQSAQLATLISNKAVRKNLTEADHRTLMAEALGEFRAAAQTRREQLESARA